ncbi:CooT family nickel-binding protein [Candidatus Bathyarchaeota archaeon]|nr:MAG: CooT family nickel-binding protein [Candidatus Bathyarchaeota archaeon]
MCEFKVFLEGKEIFRDVIYAKMVGEDLVLRDVMGEVRRFPNSRIAEMDVASARLVIERG